METKGTHGETGTSFFVQNITTDSTTANRSEKNKRLVKLVSTCRLLGNAAYDV